MATLINADTISKSYSEKPLIDSASLIINDNDKIGVVGVNGAGKTTLLNVLAGLEPVDGGTISRVSGMTWTFLPQDPVFTHANTVLEQVFVGLSPSVQFAMEFEAKSILTRLGMADFLAPVGNLSGGQRKRVALASALINPVDLLILDEPTNHLDDEMIAWLEVHLSRFTGALVLVTHDRYFLERVCNRIVEIEGGSIYSYSANYSKFLELKAERGEMDLASARKRHTLFKQELAWIRRGARARTTKQTARVDRFELLKNAKDPDMLEKVEMSSASSRLGKKTIEIEHITKSYDGCKLIDDFSHIVLRDERIGIIGPNGSGKTTLLKLIHGEISPDSGTISFGETVKLGYFSQEHTAAPKDMRVIEYVREIADVIELPDGNITASQLLERFLFSSSQQWMQVNQLSGGEKRRLNLLRVLMDAPNMLLLDEPTNDLDIYTLSVLEDYIEKFAGGVIVVSHDRYFLDKVVDRLFAFEEDGKIIKYEGGYSNYLSNKPSKDVMNTDVTTHDKKQPIQSSRQVKLKFTFKEQREFETIDQTIAHLEKSIADLASEIELKSSDYSALIKLNEKKQQLEADLSYAMDRWVYLNELAEAIVNMEKN